VKRRENKRKRKKI